MLILSKIKDRPVTLITMQDNTRYAFQPNEAGDYVAEVTNEAHIERFLSIPEGFAIYRAGRNNGEPVPDPGPQLETVPDPVPETPDMPLEHMTLADLQATFELELGRKPHHRAGIEKLIEDITAHREQQE